MENTQKGNNMIVIRVDELIHWVLRRMAWIALMGILCAGIGGYYASMIKVTPMYQATAKLYVTGVQTMVPSSGNFTLGRQVISNYIEIMESRPVMERVIDELGLNMSSQQLKNCISQRVPSDTCILEVSILFPDAEWSKAVLDEVLMVSAEYALEVMGCTPPIVYEEATVPSAPYNTFVPPIMKYAVIGGFVGVLLAGMVVLILYFINGRFHTPGKAEDILAIPVWGIVPKEERYKQGAQDVFASRLSYEAEDAKVISFVRTTAKEASRNVMQQAFDGLQKAGKKVICVDTNLGNPMWSVLGGECADTKGLHELLVGKANLSELIQKEEGRADRLLCGTKAINSGELLKSPAFGELLQQLKEAYDYIFFDVPPVQYGMDAYAVMSASDLNVWVLSAKKTKTYTAKSVKKNMVAKSVTVNGLTLIDVSVRKGGHFFKKKYGSYVGVYRK